MRLPSSSSESTRLRRLRRLPFGVMSGDAQSSLSNTGSPLLVNDPIRLRDIAGLYRMSYCSGSSSKLFSESDTGVPG